MAQNGPKIKNPDLSLRQQSALPILAAAPSITEAARLSRVGRRTLHRWLQDPEFRAQLAQLQRQSAELAKGHLQGLTLQAVLHLSDFLENPNPEIRLRAIRAILSYSIKLNDIQELHQEVQALETSLPLWLAQGKSR